MLSGSAGPDVVVFCFHFPLALAPSAPRPGSSAECPQAHPPSPKPRGPRVASEEGRGARGGPCSALAPEVRWGRGRAGRGGAAGEVCSRPLSGLPAAGAGAGAVFCPGRGQQLLLHACSVPYTPSPALPALPSPAVAGPARGLLCQRCPCFLGARARAQAGRGQAAEAGSPPRAGVFQPCCGGRPSGLAWDPRRGHGGRCPVSDCASSAHA